MTETEILSAIKKLHGTSDGIPGYVVKGRLDILVKHLGIIFNPSISSATFPEMWKRSKECHVFKGKKLVNN